MAEDMTPADKTMLVAFRAENVRSFRDPVEFSLEATALAEPGVPRLVPWRKDRNSSHIRVLPVAAVFGANASGKTNLLRAMDDMRRLVATSFRKKPRSGRRAKLHRRPFLLDPTYDNLPTSFEVEVIIDGIRYDYGFSITNTSVIAEWARHYPRGRAATIFSRVDDRIQFGDNFKGSKVAQVVEDLIRPEALFLSTAAALNYKPLKPLSDWFDNNLNLCDAGSREARWAYTAEMLEDDARRDQVLELLQIADLGITGARARQADPETMERVRTIMELMSADHEGVEVPDFDAEDTIVGFSLGHQGVRDSYELDSTDESLGTLVWLGLIGPLLDALVDGSVLLADELESSLHPSLVEEVVRLFQSPVSNPNGAQLIFNSHEARLLGNSESGRVIGRDQAWFAEKSNDGATSLYALADQGPRKSEAIARRYMEGRYGAKPILSHAEFGEFGARVASGSSR